MAVVLIEHLRVMGITARLDDGQCGIGALGCREMLIEDRAAREEACNVRHSVRKARAGDVPRQSIDEDVQHNFFSGGAVPKADRRSDGIGRIALRCECRCFRQAEMTECPFAEIRNLLRHRLRPHAKLLQVLCACNGKDDRRVRRNRDLCCAAHLLRLLELKGKVAVHLLAKHLCVADLLDECSTIREEGVVRIACRPETGAVQRHRQRQRFADEDIALKVHARFLHCGTHLDQRGEIAEAERHGEAALLLCIAALQEICGKFRGEI